MDYYYWYKYNFNNLFKLYDGSDGYLVFRPYPGGFNNIRMSLELAAVFAFIKNRTLVLPPSYHMYLLKGDSNFSDYFDIDDMGIETVSLDKFCETEGIQCSWDGVEEKFGAVKAGDNREGYADTGDISLNFEKIAPPENFTKWRRLVHWNEIVDDTKRVLFFNEDLLGNFYQVAYSSKMQQVKKYVARHIHYKAEIFDLAWDFIKELGDKEYYAIHIRRNDFQYKHVRIPCEDIVKNIAKRVPVGSKLYIATDHKEKDFFSPLEDKYNVYYYDDLKNGKEVPYNLIPIVEQLICTRAILFIGQDYSTLSSYIYRLRGYMDDIVDKNYHVNSEEFKIQDQLPLLQTPRFVANWHREHRDAWDFSEPTIFVSIASYQDSQLHETVESAFNHAANPDRVFIGVNLQDSQQYYRTLLSKSYPNTRVLFTPIDKSRGVVQARRNLIDELYEEEDYFLQVDSHTRFKDNWDNILISQLDSISGNKVIISTYPNEFTYPDPNLDYLELPFNAPLVFDHFLTDDSMDNRFKPKNLGPLNDYEVVENKRIAAGFLFTDGRWLNEIQLPLDGIICLGEEDFMTYLSYLKGWDIKLPSEAVVWHNYDWRDRDGKPYRSHNTNLGKGMADRAVDIVNEVLFKQNHVRSLEELEEFLGIEFRRETRP